MVPARCKRLASGEPEVDQGEINGWNVSWNPDDGRFYVVAGKRVATFVLWANATYWARTHKVQ